ncbi:protein translocase subunit SecD [Candidatus Shapirobacteria bacterium]|nr:protein translocase subunit SecD [Candidatus Shapirobacteria bacterium]
MKNRKATLTFIIIVALAAAIVDLPKNFRLNFSFGPLKINQLISGPDINLSLGTLKLRRELDVKQGLDLAGGTHIVFQAQMEQINKEDRDQALAALKDNIERRVNLYGVAEPVIQTSKKGEDYRLIVELAGVTDINKAVDLIGQTAQLDFREEALPAGRQGSPSGTASPSAISLNFNPTGLTGKDLKRSQVEFDQNTGQPVVGLEFNGEGAKKFEEITKKNIGKIVAIYLDQFPISLPRVEETITGGRAIIRGEFDLESAKKLSIQLNAGALPAPIKIIEQRNVGATLGAISVEKSIRAGVIGLLLVIGFMAAYYGFLGILADVALIIYGLLTLALYKLIPVTLTLPGLAGFILSVGMAVDANILIFERIKEERRAGKPLVVAMELGFGRAWDSIRDANICTLITCFILFNPLDWGFLNISGMVRGFALTLALGIAISLFTGIVVTRTFIRIFYKG